MLRNALVAALGRYPVFSVRDIAGLLDKGRGYAYLVAFRLKKAGVLREIEKGKYTLEDEPFTVASWVVWPSYVSGWAALNYYKLTEQLPFTIHVVTTRKRKKKIIHFGGAKIEFIKFRKTAFFGFKRIVYREKEVFIAEKEKAIADALAAKKMTVKEAAGIIETNRGKISISRLLSYARIRRGLAKKLREALK